MVFCCQLLNDVVFPFDVKGNRTFPKMTRLSKSRIVPCAPRSVRQFQDDSPPVPPHSFRYPDSSGKAFAHLYKALEDLRYNDYGLRITS